MEQYNILLNKIKEYLSKIYDDGTYLGKEGLKQLDDEALDILDEINSNFGGNFDRWKQYNKESEIGL